MSKPARSTSDNLHRDPDGEPAWSMRLLDDVQILDPRGQPSTLARKTVALLAYLSAQPTGMARRDVLAALLWEHVDLAQARVSLRQAILSLRRVAADWSPLIQAEGEFVRLLPQVGVDLADFERLAAGDREARRRAADLYRTDLMGSFTLREAPAFNEWLAIEQARLRQRAVALLQDAMEEALATPSDLGEAITSALRLVALDPFNEAAHRGLMLGYARQGRTALALSQFRNLAQVLRSQLQIAPEAATVHLYETLRRERQRPAEVDLARRDAGAGEASEAPGRRRPHVVVVDDEADLRESVATYLRMHDLDATEAGGGAELDAVLEGRAVDLVVLDVSMPGEDGLSIARRLSELGGIGIIMLTARGEVVDRIVGLEVGADDYLAKPFELRELLARVRALLRRTAAR